MPKPLASAGFVGANRRSATPDCEKCADIGHKKEERAVISGFRPGCDIAASHAGTNKYTRLMLLHPEEDRARLLASRLPKTGIGSLAPWGRLVGAWWSNSSRQ